jgi:hypothetical protein
VPVAVTLKRALCPALTVVSAGCVVIVGALKIAAKNASARSFTVSVPDIISGQTAHEWSLPDTVIAS